MSNPYGSKSHCNKNKPKNSVFISIQRFRITIAFNCWEYIENVWYQCVCRQPIIITSHNTFGNNNVRIDVIYTLSERREEKKSFTKNYTQFSGRKHWKRYRRRPKKKLEERACVVVVVLCVAVVVFLL